MARLLGSFAVVLVVVGVAMIASVATPASAAIITYTTNIDGPTEGTNSLGTGSATVTYDNVLHSMRVQANFTGLTGTTTAAHIHAPTAVAFTGTAGVATQQPSFSGFPLGVTSGSMDTTFDLTQASSWNATFVTNNGGTPASAETAFFNYMNQGRSYFNIHSSSFGGGEIRGFMVPEPGALTLLGAGAIVAVVRRRRAV